jgi:hypothetical protein
VVTHGADAARAFSVSSARESKRNARACIKCSSSKQKCDGHLPCQRCEGRGKACSYTELVTQRSHHRFSDERALSPQQDLPSVSNQNLENLPQRSETSLISVGGQVLSTEAHDNSCAAIHVPYAGEDATIASPQLEAFATFDPNLNSSNNEFGLVPPFWIPDFCDFSVALTDLSNLGAFDSSHSIAFPQQPDYSPNIDYNHSAADISARSSVVGPFANTTSAGQTYCETNEAESYTQDHFTPPGHNDYCTIENDEISSEHFYHVPGVSQATYGHTTKFWRRYCGDKFDVDSFPDLRQLNVLVQLYFEYFHGQTPIIHMPTFRADETSQTLLTAVAAIGCHYSAMRKVRRLAISLHGVLKLALLEQVCKLVSEIRVPCPNIREAGKEYTEL